MAGMQTVQETGEQKKTGSHWMEIRVRDFFFFPVYALKGIVHPKMKILSLITHSHVIPNQTRKTFVHLRNTNYDIFDAFFEPSDPPIDRQGS